MRRVLRTVRSGCVAFGLAVAALQAAAQQAETSGQQVALVADAVTYDTDTGVVVAEGSVEVYYGKRTLTADRIVYDSRTDTISAEGPIAIREPDGDVTVYADAAELEPNLRDGLVLGARAVMRDDVKLSAVEARRVDGRYNALSKAVYSPCRVCADDPTPLWQIRARRVIHDEQERVIHYENATFDFMGVPVFWTPYFRHADPTVRRKSGFLTPRLRQSSTFGLGVRLPYYWAIDDYSDFTIEPFVTTGDGPILIGEYRRRFGFGDFELRASGTSDDYEGEDEFHGNLQALGDFETAGGIDWGFDIDIVTDDPYLRRYDFTDDDRLDSELFVREYGTNGFFELAAVYFQSLRDDEPAGQIPWILPDLGARYELAEPVLAGELGFFADAATVVRNDGEDAARVSVGTDWERDFLLPIGLSLTPFAEARLDFFAQGQNATFAEDTEVRVAPMAGVEARYPLINDANPDAVHVLEPIAQLIVAPYGGNERVPNEDSLLTEFDETSLFERDHFPGLDGFEEGPRLNLGLRYERIASNGLDLDASIGGVFRPEDADEFSVGSGLVNAQSDWVGAWSASYEPWFNLRQRVRVSEDFALTRNEIFGGVEVDPLGLDLGYIFLEKDPRIEAPADREEVSAAARLRLTDTWSVGGFLQHDIGRGELIETGGSISFENECLALDFVVEQRFTDSDNAPSSLAFGLEVRLLTLGTEREDGNRRSARCSGQSSG